MKAVLTQHRTAIGFCSLLLVLINVISTQGANFKTILDTKYDIRPKDHNWKFPKDWPYQYYDTTKDIPQNILPVPVNSLPDGDGVWLLTYKDFLGLPRIFTQEKTSNKSVIRYTAGLNVFNNLTIKGLAFGSIQLDLIHHDYDDQVYQTLQKFSIFKKGDNCENNVTGVNENELQWTVYQLQFDQTNQVRLEAEIRQPQSFFLLDEIVVDFWDHDKVYGMFSDHDREAYDKWQQQINQRQMSCKVVP